MSTSLPSLHGANSHSKESRACSTPYDSNVLEEKLVDLPFAADAKKDEGKTFVDTLPRPVEIPNWPGPITLERTPRKRAFGLLVKIGVHIPPLFFIALIVLATRLQSQPLGLHGRQLRQVYLLGPTIFPIVFSAIVGWTLKIYGRYRSERGVKLGHLERAIGSQTLFTSLKLTFQFKQFDALCVILVLLWSLSPLGGQGILRMLSEMEKGSVYPEALEYFDLYAESHFSGASGTSTTVSTVNGLYLSSLYAPIPLKNSPTDLWGGIKIPSSDDVNIQEDDWMAVDYGRPLRYTSLLGIPVNKTFSAAAKSTFILNTTSFTVHCDDPNWFNRSSLPTPQGDATFVLETRLSFEGGVHQRHISLITFPSSRETPEGLVHNCTVLVDPLLAEADCRFGNCSISRIKRISNPDAQLTNNLIIPPPAWSNLANQLPSSSGRQRYIYSSQTERYLYDPQSNQAETNLDRPDLSQIPTVELSKRFTTLLNTYYQATIDPTFRLNALTHSSSSRDPFQTTVATVITLSDVYVCHWEWMALGSIASLAMLAAAIIGVILEKRVLVPDIYSCVSSMTRDNPYFPLPPNGCMLDGTERGVLLKDVVVRVEDVAPNKTIGHVAFIMAGYMRPERELADGRLRRDKLYSGF